MALKKMRGRKPMPGELAVVAGAGRSGLAAAKLLRKQGCRVRLVDRNPAALDDAAKGELAELGIETRLGEHKPEDFSDAAFIVASPGIPIGALAKFIQPDQNAELISEMELAWRFLDNEPIIAVTGTSGKTTTASLAAAMLKAQGYSVFLGGNIGTPLSEYVLDGRKADALVLEISSFQLQGCATFCPRVAILLNITPNHLDYHKDMEEYTEAKFRIFRCQDEGDLAILGPGLDSPDLPKIAGRRLEVKPTGRFPITRLFGKHNALNAEAAWQAARFFGVSPENAARAVENFAPLPHRLENLGEIDGVLYVNDSKCTTVSALQAALEAFERPVRLLCGGKFKGGDLAALAPLVSQKVAEIALFGASREQFEQAWKNLAPISWHETLEGAVKKLAASAQPGDVILLAPATSSFDLYRNYKDRGDDFKRIVSGLK